MTTPDHHPGQLTVANYEVSKGLLSCHQFLSLRPRSPGLDLLRLVYFKARLRRPTLALTLTLTLTLSLFNQSKNHLPPYLVADEKPYILTITHTTYSGLHAAL